MRNHLNGYAIAFNEKADFLPKEKITDTVKSTIKASSWKKIKKELSRAEREMAIMPDSVRVIPSSKQSDIKNGLIGYLTIDTKNGYYKNKNKIKYLRKHHISGPQIHIIDSLK